MTHRLRSRLAELLAFVPGRRRPSDPGEPQIWFKWPATGDPDVIFYTPEIKVVPARPGRQGVMSGDDVSEVVSGEADDAVDVPVADVRVLPAEWRTEP